MAVRTALAGLCLLASIGLAAAAEHPTAVSINQCTDGLVGYLADPAQVLGLSPYSHDPIRSWSPAQRDRFPALSGTAEDVLALAPDLVFAGRFTKRATREMLRAQGLRVVEFGSLRSIADAEAQIRDAAKRLGHPERGEAAIAAIEAAVARLKAAAAKIPLRVLPVQRRGWVPGRDTLLNSLIEAAGLRNAGGERGGGPGEMLPLETIIAIRPDLLLVSEGGDRAEDQGSALLRHPALARLYPPARRIVLPEALNLYCGGPALAEVIDAFAATLAKVGLGAVPGPRS